MEMYLSSVIIMEMQNKMTLSYITENQWVQCLAKESNKNKTKPVLMGIW